MATIRKTTVKKTTTRKKVVEKPKRSQSGVKWRLIHTFYENEYYDYCKYVIEKRAIPSIIDGLKPTARKVIYTSFGLVSEKKETNLMDLVGSTMSKTKYHHGDASLPEVITTLAKDFENVVAPLEAGGIFGTLKNDESASPRYLQIKHSKFINLYRVNENILEYNYDNGVKIEPKYFLPIIPLVLTNRTSGVAVGFRYALNMSYNPISIIDMCIGYLKTRKIKGELVPHINDWNGEYIKYPNDDKIYCRGIYSVDLTKGTVRINEFSPTETYDSFENNLNTLLDKGSILKWSNMSDNAENIDYVIHFNKDSLARLHKLRRIEKTLKISSWSHANNLNVLNENTELLEFNKIVDIVSYFADFRLNKYDKLKKYVIGDLENQIAIASELRQFIDLYLKGKIKINNKLSVAEIRKNIESFKLNPNLIETKISKLTKDEYDKLTDEIAELTKELKRVTETTPLDMYLSDLSNLKKSFKDDFKLQKLTVVEPTDKIVM